MPNGGSDCCLNCWFNVAAREVYRPSDRRDTPYCELRSIPIERAGYTYCMNNPRHSEIDEIPIGPVFAGDPLHRRWVVADSPDSESIRSHLLELVSHIRPDATAARDNGMQRDSVVVYKLGLFREKRAIPHLKRIGGLAPEAVRTDWPFNPDDHFLMQLARWALSSMDRHARSATDEIWGEIPGS